MSRIHKLLKNPLWAVEALLRHYGSIIKDDKVFLKWYYYLNLHRSLNLKNPQTYNEKLNWLKLYDHNPLYTTLVDKLKVKEYVKEKIGPEYVIKTIGKWRNVDEIEWDSLPNRFVLKTTQGGGNVGVVICRDKLTFDVKKAVKKLNYALKQNLYTSSREWPYKNVSPMIFAEEYMEDEHGELRDYKFFCFDGKCKMFFIATERQSREEPFFNFFDENNQPLPFKQGHPVNPTIPMLPKGFDDIKNIAEKLAEGLPHVRMDMYYVNGQVYFGEYTFYHFAGVMPFEPSEWDVKIGSWLKLPNVKKEDVL